MYYGQFYEDSIVEGIFARIGLTNCYVVDIGANDGLFYSNSRHFMELGWDGCFVEKDRELFSRLCKLYPGKCHNLEVGDNNPMDYILEMARAPAQPDLMTIDIDGQEYYLFKDMIRYQPRVLIIEYSPYVKPDFLPDRGSDGDEGHNQTGIQKMLELMKEKSYTVVAITPVNLICTHCCLSPYSHTVWKGRFPLYW